MPVPLVLLFAAGCGNQDPWPLTASDSWTQPPNDAIDVLFLVDDSSSMDQPQHALAGAVPDLLAQLEATDADFHLGVVTPTQVGVGSGGLVGAPAFLTRDDDDALAERMLVGTAGTGPERGLSAIDRVLSPAGGPAGFLRQDARLAIVIASTVDDCSTALQGDTAPRGTCSIRSPSVAGYAETWANSKVNPDYLQVTTIVGRDGGCASAAEGTRYLQTAAYLDGVVADICDADWSGILADVGARASSLGDRFALSAATHPESLVVDIDHDGLDQEPPDEFADDVAVDQDPENGWTYDAAGQAIVFHGSSIPEGGAAIMAYYEPIPGA